MTLDTASRSRFGTPAAARPPGEIIERPEDYLGPNLDPAGLELKPTELAPGVFALMANEMPKDNNGLIVGSHGALVVDAGINGDVARQIQAIASTLTDKPVLYLANTTYHGDHTFGNAGFPANVTIVSSRLNRESMGDLEKEKQIRSGNLRGNLAAFAAVTEWRTPDVVFDHFLELDLGGRVVQLWHFGPGNAPGDTLVYVPDSKVVWTGNFLVHSGVLPMLLEGGPSAYIETLRRARDTLDIEFMVPGHGPLERGNGAFNWLIAYLEELEQGVREQIAQGNTVEQAVANLPLPEQRIEALPERARGVLGELLPNLQRLNVLATYQELRPDAVRKP